MNNNERKQKAMSKKETVVFETLPQNIGELRGMPQASMKNPFEVAALVVAVLCRYEESQQDALDMLNFLRGARPISPYDIQFLRDRLAGKSYIPRSYFAGATSENGYKPDVPYSVTVSDDPYSYADNGFVKLDIRSGGADSPRQVQLRQKGEQWYLWENFLMADVKAPGKRDDWK